MKAKIHNFLIGIGSVFNIAPAVNLRAFGARETASERMAQHFSNVAKSLSTACNLYQSDAEAIKPKSKKY
jgi:HD-like signal output (HDOD) protein